MKHARFLLSAAAVLSLAVAVEPWSSWAAKPEPQKLPALPPVGADGKVDFARHVQPILEASCYSCHGEKKPKGKLRLDSKALAMKGGSSGAAIVPGRSAESYLVKRMRGLGGEDRMPLDHDALPEPMIQLIEKWIDQGAVWPDAASNGSAKIETHWAYVKPERPGIPEVREGKFAVRNPIDNFVLARLEREGLTPSPEANRSTLLRRVSLDLIGLPPTPAEIDAFLADASPDAYEKVVDRLLASPHFGEHWARHWLDIARYADTNGYEKDRPRVIWPYRDWVIDALNADMPFDRFTIEQIAGDMLPNATPAQHIATGFHRNTMINEEGGIDVEEFRFKATVDRVQTTATTWLAQTLQCAQCHNHKYDPFSQKEYYRFFALLNNADEIDLYPVPDEGIAAKRREAEAQIAKLEGELASRFPAGPSQMRWSVLKPTRATAASGATLSIGEDGSVLASGTLSATDTYTIEFKANLDALQALKLEALTDPSLMRKGPGRKGAENGNFVVTDVKAIATPAAGGKGAPVVLSDAQADVSQGGFPVAYAIDGDAKTGWAVDDGTGRINADHSATFRAKSTVSGEATLTVTLAQSYANHTLGKFRFSAGLETRPVGDQTPEAREKYFQQRLAEWETQAREKAGHWVAVRPTAMTSRGHATMTVLDDESVLVSGDKPNFDTYEVELSSPLKGVTAIRLEVLPDSSLPDGGPGRAPLFQVGDFLLSELEVATVNGTGVASPVKLSGATHDHAAPNRSAAAALDGKLDTGWSINGKVGQAHRAVFTLAEPLANAEGSKLLVRLIQQYIHQTTIGRFRLSVTDDAKPRAASELPPEIETIVLVPSAWRSEVQRRDLRAYFLSIAPELSGEHQRLASLRKGMPKFVNTMVMQEREAHNARVTRVHHRGEFLQPKDPVTPGVPAVLHPLAGASTPSRLDLARWLVSTENPLAARVTVNRLWATLYGRGLVATIEDFGVQGEKPSHPELLDYLATEFMARGWSQKAMLRLIVTSATYRQSSRVTPELAKRDPLNVLLARGPRFRVDAETVRDIALASSGLLSEKIGGPSVYPPQPPGISELSYGPMPWPTSSGPDRYRRGLYTFLKRTSPYPGLTTFDAPTADVTCPKRPRSNTPLQALQLLNDAVFTEAAQALARRVVAGGPADPGQRIAHAFRLCTGRSPTGDESAAVLSFYQTQLERFRSRQADPAPLVAPERPKDADLVDLGAWTLVSRALLNLDETVTKE